MQLIRKNNKNYSTIIKRFSTEPYINWDGYRFEEMLGLDMEIINDKDLGYKLYYNDDKNTYKLISCFGDTMELIQPAN